MARPSLADKRKKEIVAAMIYEMGSNGYSGATIKSIGKRAKLAPGATHYYFEDKRAILFDLLLNLSDAVLQRFKLRTVNNANDQLAAYIDAHLAYGSDADINAINCWQNIAAIAAHDEDVQTALQEITLKHITLLDSLCEAALVSDKRVTHKKKEIALAIYAAIEGAYRLHIAAPEMITHGIAPTIVRHLTSALVSAQRKI